MAWFPFGGNNQQQQQQQQQRQQQQQNQQNPNQQQQGQGQQQQNQQQDFSNFWKPAENKAGLNSPIPAFDLNQVLQLGRQQRFVNTQSIPQDVAQKLQSGDFTPLLELMQNVGQMVYAKALHDSAMVTQNGFNQFSQQVTDYVPSVVTDSSFKNSLASEYDKLASDPRYAPIFDAAVSQINNNMMGKPEAERKQAVVDYFRGLATSMGAKFEDGNAGTQNQNDQFNPANIGVGENGQVDDWSAFTGDNVFASFNQQQPSSGGQPDMAGSTQASFPSTAAPSVSQ